MSAQNIKLLVRQFHSLLEQHVPCNSHLHKCPYIQLVSQNRILTIYTFFIYLKVLKLFYFQILMKHFCVLTFLFCNECTWMCVLMYASSEHSESIPYHLWFCLRTYSTSAGVRKSVWRTLPQNKSSRLLEKNFGLYFRNVPHQSQ